MSRKSRFYLLIALVVVVGSLAAGGGVYLWQNYLRGQRTAPEATADSEEADDFQPEDNWIVRGTRTYDAVETEKNLLSIEGLVTAIDGNKITITRENQSEEVVYQEGELIYFTKTGGGLGECSTSEPPVIIDLSEITIGDFVIYELPSKTENQPKSIWWVERY